MKHFALILILLTPLFSSAEWRPRIREHFELLEIDVAGQSFSYKGATNTFNFWYEVPMKYSIGLAFGPLLGSAKNQEDTVSSFLGEEIHLLHLGVEGKYFPINDLGLFLRGGLYGSELDKAGRDIQGMSALAGVGWEFLYKRVGIALEIAYRYTDLSDDVKVTAITPALGVHFYRFF